MNRVVRRLRNVCVVVGVIALFGACGGDEVMTSTPSSTNATSPSVNDPDDPVTSPSVDPSDPTDPGEPTRVVPRPGMADVRPTAFDVENSVATSGGVLVRYWTGVAPCSVLDHYDVVETDEVATITLFVGSDPDRPDAVCIELALLGEVKVPLSVPLGDRTLVDGSVT